MSNKPRRPRPRGARGSRSGSNSNRTQEQCKALAERFTADMVAASRPYQPGQLTQLFLALDNIGDPRVHAMVIGRLLDMLPEETTEAG